MSDWKDLYQPRSPQPADGALPPAIPKQSVGLLRIATRACLAADIGLLVIAVWSAQVFTNRFHVYQDVVTGDAGLSQLDATDRAVAAVRGAMLPLLFLVLVMLALWTWAAHGVAERLSPGLPGTRRMAFFGWLIPVAGFILGPLALTRIWRAIDEGALRHHDSPPFVIQAWTIGVLASLGFALRLAIYATYWSKGDEANISHAADLAATGYWLI